MGLSTSRKWIAIAVAGVLAATVVAWLLADRTTCELDSCGGESAPDPGGSESASVSLPEPGFEFGFNDNAQVEGVPPTAFADLARVAGSTVRRFPVDWRLVEPYEDRWDEADWEYYEAAYRSTLAAGMRPLINFGFAPAWAREPGDPQACADFFACRYPPAEAMNGQWRDFAKEVAQRFPKAILEVWNEPNLAIFWRPTPDPERFAELQAIAYDAIKGVDASIPVLAGGLSAIQPAGTGLAGAGPADMPLEDFLERAYESEHRLKDHMDALSFHPYALGGELGENSELARGFADIRTAVQAAGDGRRRLWVTETGIPTSGEFGVSEEVQADVTIRLYRRLATMPDVDGVLIHRLLPPPTEPIGSIERGYALIRGAEEGGAPKPAFCELVSLARRSYPEC